MIQKKFLLGVFILLFHAAIAQTPVQNKFDLPSFVPPSPELATLANLGQVNNTLHTGTASVNIPLMEFTVGNLKLPVAISYAPMESG